MRFCCGFAFTCDGQSILLVRKEKPQWQAGLLNGIGGKIEAGECGLDAMVREFNEEAGVLVENGWERFAIYAHGGNIVEFFRVFSDEIVKASARNDVGELIVLSAADALPARCIPNLCWLVPMARDARLEVPISIIDSGGFEPPEAA